ncbi:hypothetical protein [Hydrogenobaculum acidophilum]
MLNTKNAITILLIVLGLTLFYLWYSTWHRNISTNNLNKQLIQENVKHEKPLQTPTLTPASAKPTPTNAQNAVNVDNSNSASNTSAQMSNVKSKPNHQSADTNSKKAFTNNIKTTKIKKVQLVKRSANKNFTRYRKPTIPITSKPIVKQPFIRKPTIPYPAKNKGNSSITLKLQKNAQKPNKFIYLKNGTYQAGAFKYFSDALSFSLELKAQGKRTKIIHQDGLYKVIVY